MLGAGLMGTTVAAHLANAGIPTLVLDLAATETAENGIKAARLKFLATLTPGKVAAHFDRVDRQKFKEPCGDVMCFRGRHPRVAARDGHAAAGQGRGQATHRPLRRYGRLMSDGANTVPDEAKPDVTAMTEAVHGYGRF